MKIPKTAIQFTYNESKRVFENKLPIKEAAEHIHKKHGIKINSAIDYGYYFRYLITGEGSCRSLSSYTQKYYLDRIQKEYSNEQFEKSLAHFKKLIEKFEGSKVGSKKGMRAIYDAYNK
jgi:hypothetical protein